MHNKTNDEDVQEDSETEIIRWAKNKKVQEEWRDETSK